MNFSMRLGTNIGRLLVVSIVCFTLFLGASSVAMAQSASIKLASLAGPPTSSVKVSGTGFDAKEQVTITFDTAAVGSASTTSKGSFSVTFTVPGSAQPGNHTVQATDTSGLMAQATFLVQTNWTMFGSDLQHTRVNPYENVLNTTNVAGLTVDWTFPTNGYLFSSPAVVNGVVYIASGDAFVYAVDYATGVKKWAFKTQSTQLTTSPAVVSNTVYVGAGEFIDALSAKTGHKLWSYDAGANSGGFASSPAVAQEMINGMSTSVVYFGALDDYIYALNARTGALLWKFLTQGQIVDSSPAVANGVVYIGADQLYALDAATGAFLWSGPFNNKNGTNSSPAVANGLVYIGAIDHNLDAFNAAGCGSATCAPVWTFATGSFIDSSPAVATEVINGVSTSVVYVGSYDHNVYAVNALTGVLVWTFSSVSSAAFISSPAVANGVVYTADQSNFYALDATSGVQLFSYATTVTTQSSPSVADGVVRLGVGNTIVAFHLPGTTP